MPWWAWLLAVLLGVTAGLAAGYLGSRVVRELS